eukprot:SAG11_NODE_1027_length_6131_cov_22.835710_3_plen_339_part_00
MSPAPALLVLAAAGLAGLTATGLTVPPWDWEPAPGRTSQHCLCVPDTRTKWYNTSTLWANNSRLLSVAVPEGRPPPSGWPVMIDLLVISYPFQSPREAGTICGTGGTAGGIDYPPSWQCAQAVARSCGRMGNGTFYTCRAAAGHCSGLYSQNDSALLRGCGPPKPARPWGSRGPSDDFRLVMGGWQRKCPRPPALSKPCRAALARRCGWALKLEPASDWMTNCSRCVGGAIANLTADASLSCPTNTTPGGPLAPDLAYHFIKDFCVIDSAAAAGLNRVERLTVAAASPATLRTTTPGTAISSCPREAIATSTCLPAGYGETIPALQRSGSGGGQCVPV